MRRLDRPTAMRIFDGILHYARTAFRLRLRDYRVLFALQDNVMRIFGVRHRSGAYRSTAAPRWAEKAGFPGSSRNF